MSLAQSHSDAFGRQRIHWRSAQERRVPPYYQRFFWWSGEMITIAPYVERSVNQKYFNTHNLHSSRDDGQWAMVVAMVDVVKV